MGILIGMDEAGYGPHLGPLVVAGTAWEVPDEVPGVGCGEPASAGGQSGAAVAQLSLKSRARTSNAEIGTPYDLYRLLRNIVSKNASERRIAIADSKALYHPGQGLRQLERGLHTVLRMLEPSLGCWSHIVRYCEADPDGHHRRVCWPDGFDCTLPIDAAADELPRLAVRLGRACDGVGVRPLAIRAKLLFPEQFNELVAYYDSKGAALSHVTVGLLREVMEIVRPPVPRVPSAEADSPVYVVCDKHGGRNFYTALLQHHFSDHWIEPVCESHAQSRYEWGPPESRVRVTFRVNGETFLPTALASMTAKYLRELAMKAFNTFWRAHVPSLRPTAGYYRDAWRFKHEIAAKQRELGIDDYVVWRER